MGFHDDYISQRRTFWFLWDFLSTFRVAEDSPELVDVGVLPTDPRRQEHELHFKEAFYDISGEVGR